MDTWKYTLNNAFRSSLYVRSSLNELMTTQKLNQCRKLQSLEIINHLPIYFGGMIGWHGIVYLFVLMKSQSS